MQTPSLSPVRARIVCRDGFELSVQASATHYCTPRNNDGPYTAVEVGLLGQTPEPAILRAYADGHDGTPVAPSGITDGHYSTRVYPYVPASVVASIIGAHGGATNPDDLPPMIDADGTVPNVTLPTLVADLLALMDAADGYAAPLVEDDGDPVRTMVDTVQYAIEYGYCPPARTEHGYETFAVYVGGMPPRDDHEAALLDVIDGADPDPDGPYDDLARDADDAYDALRDVYAGAIEYMDEDASPHGLRVVDLVDDEPPYVVDVREAHAYHLASMADVMTPDGPDSPGARFLKRIHGDYVADLAFGRFHQSVYPADELTELADGATPVYTHDVWATFVDLGAYREDPVGELGATSDDLTDLASSALYLVASRLLHALATADGIDP